MELSDYIQVIRRRWRIIVTTFLVTLALAAGFTAVTTPQYSASAELYVSTASTEGVTDLAQGSTFTQRQVTTYADVATTPYVLDPVIDELALDLRAGQLAQQITVQAPANTALLEIAVTDADPDQALSIAQGVSEQLVLSVEALDQVDPETASPVKATVITPANVGTDPVTPQPLRNLALAAVLGLLLGVGLALLRDLLDTSVRGEADARAIVDAPVLGGITFDKGAAANPTIVVDEPHHSHSEAFRSLRTNLQFVNAGDPPKSIVLTSSMPEEGKTTTTAHLALTLAATGRRVCVVEGDLRRPRLMNYLGMEGGAGLTNVLIGEVGLDEMLQPYADSSLTLLGSGPIPPNPAEILGSDRMRAVMADLEQRFDIVIVDAPPLLPVTDAAVLARVTDGAVVVVGVGIITRDHLARTVERLEKAQGPLLGLILNRVPAKGVDSYDAYSADYGPEQTQQPSLEQKLMPQTQD